MAFSGIRSVGRSEVSKSWMTCFLLAKSARCVLRLFSIRSMKKSASRWNFLLYIWRTSDAVKLPSPIIIYIWTVFWITWLTTKWKTSMILQNIIFWNSSVRAFRDERSVQYEFTIYTDMNADTHKKKDMLEAYPFFYILNWFINHHHHVHQVLTQLYYRNKYLLTDILSSRMHACHYKKVKPYNVMKLYCV